jgi:quercetin dioxygenase-like cupin family protein
MKPDEHLADTHMASAMPVFTRRHVLSMLGLAGLASATRNSAFAHETQPEPRSSAEVREIFRNVVGGSDDWELVAKTVEYPPSGSSKPHRHARAVFVFVLEGEVEMQLEGGPLTIYGAGAMLYEPPNAFHLVSRNRSSVYPARLLALFIGEKGVSSE